MYQNGKKKHAAFFGRDYVRFDVDRFYLKFIFVFSKDKLFLKHSYVVVVAHEWRAVSIRYDVFC